MLDDLLPVRVVDLPDALFGEYSGTELRPGQAFTLDFDLEGNLKTSFD